jgi:hypothetical protein
MESRILALKKAIGTSNTNWYFQIPIGTSNTNWYTKYELVLRVPIGTSSANWYFEYQLVHRRRSVHNNKVDIRAALALRARS